LTISSSIRKAGPFTGNGVTVAFPFYYKVFSAADVLVVQAVTATGVETTKVLTTDYTVSLNADQNANPGGTVTMLVSPPTGTTITLGSKVGNLQPTDLTNFGGFYPTVINDALDRATIQVQQVSEKVDRAMKSSISTPSGVSSEIPLPSPYKVLAWNGTGTALENTDPSTSSALAANLSASSGSSLVGYLPSGTGAVATTVQTKLRESRSFQDFGGIADWNGTTGTDQTAVLQMAIDSFAARGVLYLGKGGIRADSARIDFKQVTLIGEGTTQAGSSGGTELYVGSVGGLYSSIQNNLSPRHENLNITSSSLKLANGQVLMDLTGLNYPNLTNVTMTGGEVGLKISKGATIESHYGTFTNVNCSKCYTGISVNTGLYAQTHSFFGGRMWDCVEGYANEGTGASDINFYGTAFESDQAIRHAATATAAQTKWFACRNESGTVPNVTVGEFTEIGTYWSGNRRAEAVYVGVTGASGVLSEYANRVVSVGVNNAVDQVAPNVLPNAIFEFDPSSSRTSSTIVPGWVPFGATHYDSGKSSEGNYIRLERQAALGTVGITSKPFPLKKGKYLFSTGWKKDGYGVNGTVKVDFLVGGVSFGAAGTYADATLPLTYAASEYLLQTVEILQDIADFQFRVQCDASTNGRYFYIFNPVMAKGLRGAVTAPVAPRANYECDGLAAPTTGTWGVGARVWNITPTAGGVMGWVCTTAGTPGTWKTFGAIAA
jgi:hypothetical protein